MAGIEIQFPWERLQPRLPAIQRVANCLLIPLREIVTNCGEEPSPA
jgi:hypothetical protein